MVVHRTWEGFKAVWNWIPILGPLARCGLADHGRAIKQFLTDVFFATLPLWLGTIVLVFTDRTEDMGAWMAFVSTLNSGELFLFCTATLGPIVYLVNKERGGGTFPGRLSHMVFVMAICVVCAVMFSLQRADVWLNPDLLLTWSVGLYSLTLVLHYLTIVYDLISLPSAPVVFKEQETDFVNKLKDHRG